jgi:hypothetical protein
MKGGRGRRWWSCGSSSQIGYLGALMPGKSKSRKFATQAEEAAWWQANEDRLADEFEKAMELGKAWWSLLEKVW